MYEVIFYEDKNGWSELVDQLKEIAKRAPTSKDTRIQYNQIVLSINLLKEYGTWLPIIETKHLVGNIWELRPGHNRILYFYYKDNTFVLLHMFRKQTQKTPKREIEKAIKEMNDYITRTGGNKNEKLG